MLAPSVVVERFEPEILILLPALSVLAMKVDKLGSIGFIGSIGLVGAFKSLNLPPAPELLEML